MWWPTRCNGDVEKTILIMADKQTLRLHAETLQVTPQRRDVGTVSVSVTTETHDHAVDTVLTSSQIEVRHVPMNRMVDRMPQSRHEGDTMIIPVVEEVMVVRYRVVEEIHVTRISHTRRHQEIVSLRAERAVVTRSDVDGDLSSTSIKSEQKETNHAE